MGAAAGLKTYYDEEEDILYLARPGAEEESVEIAPGLTVEFDKRGRLLGIEILRASRALRSVAAPLLRRAQRAA